MQARTLRRHARGTVAIEVALVTPIYLMLVFGMVDVGRFFIWLDQARRCAVIAGNAASQADPATGNISVSASFMYTILAQVAGAAPAGNWSSTNGLIMTAIVLNSYGFPAAELQTRYPSNLSYVSPYSCGASFNPPISFTDVNDTVFVSEVYYTFVPFTFLSAISGSKGSITIHDYSFYRVRQPTSLTSSSSC